MRIPDGIKVYDRAGNRLYTWEEFDALLSTDYRIVEQTEIGPYWVSTIWLGIDHNWFGDGPPILFETLVFCPEEDSLGIELDGRRYHTETEAQHGHDEFCTVIRATMQEEFHEKEER